MRKNFVTQYFNGYLEFIAFALSASLIVAMFFVQPTNASAYDTQSQNLDLGGREAQALSQAVTNGDLPDVIDLASAKLESVKTVTTSYYRKVIRKYYQKISPTRCYYLNKSRNIRGYSSLPCTARFTVTSTWLRNFFDRCNEPKDPTSIQIQIFMLAWQVTVTANFATDSVCDRIQWRSVTCNVDWSLGWDIDFSPGDCKAVPGLFQNVFYKNTFFIAQWKAIFLHRAVGVIQFGHCYRSGADPDSHREYDFRSC